MQSRHPVILLAAVVLPTAVACADQRAPAPGTSLDLRPHSPPAQASVPLRPVPLATQEDFDRFEASYLPRVSPDVVIAVYESMAEDADPAADPGDALLLQRLALLRLTRGSDSERMNLNKGFDAIGQLRDKAPNSPHTRYLLAFLKFLVVNDRGRTPGGPGPDPAMVRDLREELRMLESAHPGYRGPEGKTVAELAREVDRIGSAGELAEPAPDAGAEMVRAPAGERIARDQLWSYQLASAGDRLGLCRDRREQGRAGGDSTLEREMDLRCAVVLGEAEAGIAALAALSEGYGAEPTCSWVSRLAAKAGALAGAPGASELAAALEARGWKVCPGLR